MAISQAGYLYFIESFHQCAGKIGFGGDPERRVIQMQTGNPQPLVLACALPATYASERALHEMLKEHHITLEWFGNLPLLRAIFCALEDTVAGLEFDDEDYTVTPEMIAEHVPLAAQGLADYVRDYGPETLEPMGPLGMMSGGMYPISPHRLTPRQRSLAA